MLFSISTFHNVYLDCDTVIKYTMVDWLVMWQIHIFFMFVLCPIDKGAGRDEGNNGGGGRGRGVAGGEKERGRRGGK